MQLHLRCLTCFKTNTAAGHGHSLPKAQNSLEMLQAALQGSVNTSESAQGGADLQEEAQLRPGGL